MGAQDFKQLEVALMQLNSASDNLILQELCKMKLKDVYDKLLNAIIAYFDRICVKANEMYLFFRLVNLNLFDFVGKPLYFQV